MATSASVYHTRTFPLQVNQCRLDPAVCGSFLALPLTKTTVGLWELTDLKSEPANLTGHKRSVTALCFSHDEPRLLCSVAQDYMIVWNVKKCLNNSAKGEEVRGQIIVSCPEDVNHVCFNMDASQVAMCTGNVVKLVSISASKVAAELTGHTAKVMAAEFCPHFSATLVTTSDDRTVIVWDVQNFTLIYQSAILCAASLITLCMNKAEAHVAVASAGGTIKVFDLADNKNFRELYEVNVGKLLSKFRAGQQLKQGPALVNGPVLVNKRVSSKNVEAEAQGGDAKISYIESSDSVLSLLYANPGDDGTQILSAQDHSTLFPSGNDAVGHVLAANNPVLVILSSHCMIQVDSKTLEVLTIVDLQESMPSIFQPTVKEVTISGVELGKVEQLSCRQLVAVVGTQFESRVHSIQWELASPKNYGKEADLESSLNNLTHDSMKAGAESCLSSQSQDDLNIVAIRPLLDNSPLKAELVSKSTSKTSIKNKTQTSKKSMIDSRGKKLDPMNQPLTFKTKVKSSGYTQAPYSTMFKPQINSHSKAEDLSKTQTGTGQSLMAKLTSQEYPQDAGHPVEVHCRLSTGTVPTAVNSLKFSGTGRSLACCLANKTTLVFSAPFDQKNSNVFIGHDSSINSVNWSNSGKYILTASNDKTALLWDRATAEVLITFNSIGGNFDNSHSENVKRKDSYLKDVKSSQFFFMDKFVLIIEGNHLHLYKYHVDTEKDDIRRYLVKSKYKLVKSWETTSQAFTALSAVNAFYSHLVICAGSNRDVEIYDLNVGRLAHIFNDCHTKPAHAIALNEGSTYTSQPPEALNVFATSSAMDCIKMWDVRSRRCVLRLQGHSNQAYGCGIAFSACGTYIASGSEDKMTYVYDIRQGTFCEKLKGHTDVVSSVVFHPAQPVLASGAIDGKLILFKA